jgi:glycosyltransferase involved in cell wall biosynthesis
LDRRIRLVQLTHDLRLGGLEQVVMTLCRTIDRDQFDVSVLCLWGLGEFAEQLQRDGIQVQQVPESRQGDRKSFLKLAKVLREKRIDVLHTHNTAAFLDGAAAGFLARTPTIIHTDHARDFPDRLRYMVAEHVASHLVYRVVGVSEHTTENLRRYERIPRRKLLTIPNGIDGARFRVPVDRQAMRRALGVPQDAVVLGMATRLTPQKDIETTLRALALVVNRAPNLFLLIAGTGPLENELRNLTAQLGLSEHVRFLGLRYDMPEVFATFDVYVSSSLWEGLPMAILEAMAAGCAVVATEVGGVATAVQHEHNGTLVAPGNAPALAQAVYEMVADVPRRQRFAKASADIFAQRFDAKVMARSYEALYARKPLPGQVGSDSHLTPAASHHGPSW